jgi:hypothetical protein
MPLRKLEETVVKSRTGPLKRIDRMTGRTVFREACSGMVRLCCSIVILPVAINAVNPDDIKAHKTFGEMTDCAISRAVRSKQREPAQLMDFCDICYKPAGCGMAPGTIRSYGALVHISMAFNAVSLCFTEYQSWMTESAVSLGMLTGEG